MAGFTVLGNSTKFEEPESGFVRLFLHGTGIPSFFHITIKEGINVRIYDPAHKADRNQTY